MRDGGIEQAADLGGVFGLAEDPHHLCVDGFGGHVVGFKDEGVALETVADG